MRKKVAKEDRAISLQKQTVRLDNYTQVKNGMFDPVCPAGYNFVTGYVDWRCDMQINKVPFPSMGGNVNGTLVHEF